LFRKNPKNGGVRRPAGPGGPGPEKWSFFDDFFLFFTEQTLDFTPPKTGVFSGFFGAFFGSKIEVLFRLERSGPG
jgi:hypothetical protein